MKADIGIIGAMSVEIEALIAELENRSSETVSGVEFNTGSLFGKKIVHLFNELVSICAVYGASHLK